MLDEQKISAEISRAQREHVKLEDNIRNTKRELARHEERKKSIESDVRKAQAQLERETAQLKTIETEIETTQSRLRGFEQEETAHKLKIQELHRELEQVARDLKIDLKR